MNDTCIPQRLWYRSALFVEFPYRYCELAAHTKPARGTSEGGAALRVYSAVQDLTF